MNNTADMTVDGLVAEGAELHGLDGLAGAVFGVGNDEVDRALVIRQAPLIRGAVAVANRQLLTDFAADLAESRNDPRWDGVLSEVASHLPALDDPYVDEAFLAKFHGAAVAVGERLAAGWSPPRSVAEELVVIVLLDYTRRVFDQAGLNFFEDASAALENALLGQFDVFALYRSEPHFPSDYYRVENWFTPFGDAAISR